MWRRVLCAMMLALGMSAAAWAEPAPSLTATDVGAFFDHEIAPQLAKSDIAGAVVTVVADHRILFSRGYGFADIAAKKPVDPAATLFRVGSISKLFAWTSVMQLVEQGKLDLDRDINDYLDFRVTGLDGAKITLRHLMMHRAGFEFSFRDIASSALPDGGIDLAQTVKTHIPPVHNLPGTIMAYSNYDAELAAYIVQRVAHKPYERWLQDAIFTPLAMAHTTIAQPVPENFDLSKSYVDLGGDAQKFVYVLATPAGAVSSTGDDIGRFMLGYLQPGILLQDKTVRQMLALPADSDPRVGGLGLGFFLDHQQTPTPVAGHGGDLPHLFHSDLHLLPRQGVGVFVSFNGDGRDGAVFDLRRQIWTDFMTRYYPSAPMPQKPQAIASAKPDSAALAGEWLPAARREHGILRVMNLAQKMTVTARPDGRLAIDGLPRPLTEIDHDLWQDDDGKNVVAVRRDRAGRILALDGGDIMLERTSLDETAGAAYALLAAFGALLLLLMAMPLRGLARRWRQGRWTWHGAPPVMWQLAQIAPVLAMTGMMAVMAPVIVDFRLTLMTTATSRPWLMGVRYLGFLIIASAVLSWGQFIPAGAGRRPVWLRIEQAVLCLALTVIAAGMVIYGFVDPSYDF